MSLGDIFKVLSVLVAFFGVILLYVFEMDYFSNTIDSTELILWSMGCAALFGAILGFIFSLFTGVLIEKFQLIVGTAVFCTTLGPLTGSLTNRMLAGEDVLERRYRVVEYKPFSTSIMGAKSKGHDFRTEGRALIAEYRGARERFVYRTNALPGIEEGDLVALPFQNGFWGFPVLITALNLEDTVDPSELPDRLYPSDTTQGQQ